MSLILKIDKLLVGLFFTESLQLSKGSLDDILNSFAHTDVAADVDSSMVGVQSVNDELLLLLKEMLNINLVMRLRYSRAYVFTREGLKALSDDSTSSVSHNIFLIDVVFVAHSAAKEHIDVAERIL